MNIGERIGDYEIIQILGAGGMGQVYKVRNVLSDRIEAMKVLLPNLEGDPGLADRFLNEIKVQATLDHPNIAKLHTAMRSGNQLVMVMEFVDGTSLAQVLQRGPLPPSTAAAYASQVLDALGYAHAHGVIHRDIKPANIMLAADGHIKLMDFGIARVQADRRLTQTGSTVGSLFYMSPEQIKGGDPDGRSDLYSLGITMYEMVTGRRPFLGDSDFQIMSAHLQQAPMAPIEVIPGIPSALSDIILMAIEKDPAARFQSAEAFRAALGQRLPRRGPDAHPHHDTGRDSDSGRAVLSNYRPASAAARCAAGDDASAATGAEQPPRLVYGAGVGADPDSAYSRRDRGTQANAWRRGWRPRRTSHDRRREPNSGSRASSSGSSSDCRSRDSGSSRTLRAGCSTSYSAGFGTGTSAGPALPANSTSRRTSATTASGSASPGPARPAGPTRSCSRSVADLCSNRVSGDQRTARPHQPHGGSSRRCPGRGALYRTRSRTPGLRPPGRHQGRFDTA